MELIAYPLLGVMAKVWFDPQIAGTLPAGEMDPPMPAEAVLSCSSGKARHNSMGAGDIGEGIGYLVAPADFPIHENGADSISNVRRDSEAWVYPPATNTLPDGEMSRPFLQRPLSSTLGQSSPPR